MSNLSEASKQALVNELKGNIFEFLVAQNLAVHFRCEEKFLLNLSDSTKILIEDYHQSLSKIDNEVLLKIMLSLKAVIPIITDKIAHLFPQKIVNIHWLGKILARNDNAFWGEADIVLILESDNDSIESANHYVGISLKLCKKNSFINTKSAGLKSFFEKYFSVFESHLVDQEKFSKAVDRSFFQLGYMLYQKRDWTFPGYFCALWKNNESELPGDLAPDDHEVLLNLYQDLNQLLYTQLIHYHNESAEKFLHVCRKLIGLSKMQEVMVLCEHEQHEILHTKVIEFDEIVKIKHAEIVKKPRVVEIFLDQIILQLRIKPMNKFTTPSYKLNCSIKRRDSREDK